MVSISFSSGLSEAPQGRYYPRPATTQRNCFEKPEHAYVNDIVTAFHWV